MSDEKSNVFALAPRRKPQPTESAEPEQPTNEPTPPAAEPTSTSDWKFVRTILRHGYNEYVHYITNVLPNRRQKPS